MESRLHQRSQTWFVDVNLTVAQNIYYAPIYVNSNYMQSMGSEGAGCGQTNVAQT